MGDLAATSLVGADGRFTFLNVAEGIYSLEATRTSAQLRLKADTAGFREMEFAKSGGTSGLSLVDWDVSAALPGLQFVTTRVDSALTTYWARQTVVVGSGDADLTLAMRPSGTMRGRIVKEITLQAPVPRIEPVAGVHLDPANGGLRLGAPRSKERPEDSSGDFSIDDLMPGKYFLRARNGWSIKSIVWKGVDYTDTAFDAAETQAFNDVEVVVTNGAATLAGTALDQRGTPGRRVVIAVFPASTAFWTECGLWSPRIRSVVAARDGRYEIAGLPAGDYRVVAIDDPSAALLINAGLFEQFKSVATPITLSWSKLNALNLLVHQRVP
jgi:hypothetical protein